MDLDRIDLDILAALQNNARLANKELAAKVGLAPSSCLQRVRALTREGVLRGHHAQVTASAVGIGLEALVAVRLFRHSRDAFRTLYRHLLSLPEVLAVFHVSGVNDLQVHVAVRGIEHLRELVVEHFAARSEVDHCETAVIFELQRKHALPCYLKDAAPPRAAAAARAPSRRRRARSGR